MKHLSFFSTVLQIEAIDFIEHNQLSVRWINVEDSSCWVSKNAAQLVGYSQNTLIETPSLWEECIFPDDKIIYKKALEMGETGDYTEVEYRVIHSNGSILWLQERVTPYKDEQGKVLSISSVLIDITDRKCLSSKLDESEERFHSLLETAPLAFIIHQEEEIVYSNPAAEDVLGTPLIGKNILDLVHPESRELFAEQIGLLNKGEKTEFLQYKMVSFIGKEIMVEGTGQRITLNGQPAILSFGRDITRQVELEKVVDHLAFHDYLTGLPNRFMLKKQLSAKILKAKEKNSKLALLFIDLDRFKLINDTLNHSAGDFLLKEVANRIKRLVRKSDYVFRQGGDEFIIILSDADSQAASMVAQRIVDSLSKPFVIDQEEIYTSPSIGISIYPEDGQLADLIIKNADIAMYQAKRAGKNNYQFYSSHHLEEVLSPLKIEMDLRKGLERNEFVLHYQPKVNLYTGKIVGLEALIRWNHPEFGMLPPNTFIPIAEETGLIIPIGNWALYEACSQNMRWHQQGIKTVVSVNLSGRQFTQSEMVQTIAEVLHHTRLKPQFLEIEITESMTIDIEHAIPTLEELKYLGVKISIDDFGTGFSSLNYLKKLPVDTLKIDKSFVRELYKNPHDETIVKTIVSMAHNLNLNVVAEGIETNQQLVFLQQHLCNYGQGYFFSKPQSASEIEANFQEIEQIVEKCGISPAENEIVWNEELFRLARKELEDTIRLQQGITKKVKKINGHFIHTLCDGELLYRLGLTPDQIIGKKVQEFYPENMAAKIVEHYQKAWNDGEQVTYENEINGIHYLATLRPIKRGGEVVEIIGSYTDITDRIMAWEALKESESKYRLIAENMNDLIGILDSNGNLLFASPSVEHVLGYHPEYYKNNNPFENIHPEDIDSVSRKFAEMIQTKQTTQGEFRYLHRNGNWVLIEVNWTPVNGNNNEVEHIVAVARDITEKRRAEEQLRKTEKLTIVGQLAAGVAHEIRNPLTTVKGFIQLFKQNNEKLESLDIILSEVNRIEHIINEFLSFAKTPPFKVKTVEMTALLVEVKQLVESKVPSKGVNLLFEWEENLLPVKCDPFQIIQVLVHLITNSIDASLKGGIIKIKVSSEDSNLLISVMDNGIGIPDERLQKLGEPFYSNKEKGTGLGLMLCSRIIKEHNGTITFKSKVNQGTTVEIRLPF